MRFGLLILTVFINSFSQQELEYQYDENGHILFLEVVETELDHEILLANATELMTSSKKEDHEATKASFKKTLEFKLYKKRLGQSPHGELSCPLKLEVRESRYRYIIDEFEFQLLERDRYGRFIQKKGASTGLEEYFQNPTKVWGQSQKDNIG